MYKNGKNGELNEDDTFRVLTRLPFDQVKQMIKFCNMTGGSRRMLSKILSDAKWTDVEYMKALVELRCVSTSPDPHREIKVYVDDQS